MVFTKKDGDFHGRTVSLREGKLFRKPYPLVNDHIPKYLHFQGRIPTSAHSGAPHFPENAMLGKTGVKQFIRPNPSILQEFCKKIGANHFKPRVLIQGVTFAAKLAKTVFHVGCRIAMEGLQHHPNPSDKNLHLNQKCKKL